MMIYLREARAQEGRQAGMAASIGRAAVAAAVVNTFSGKDTPEFDEMVNRLMGEDENEHTAASMPGLDELTMPDGSSGFVPIPGALDGFKEF